ncbi:Fc.00g060170.m01.CDS01 [Cosmosporella sp. VM-42]
MSEYSGTASPAPSSDQSSALVPTKRRPIPRKGHTKSRAGCLSCKRRKVKCDELSPACGPCQRLGLGCQYVNKKRPTGSRPESSGLARTLGSEPSMFDMDDMRFFRHFLFDAYPPLPIDGFTVWQQVSQLSHEYEFLMHAMLGLGASHLSLLSSADYERAALKHRVAAIKALNEHLSKPELTMPEAEAAFGALIALTFQSAYMPEGLMDFLTMVRGCFLIGTHRMPDMDSSTFKTFARPAYVAKIRELITIHEIPIEYLDTLIVDEFCASTRRLGPLCKSIPELEYLAHMQRIAGLALTDPGESYEELSFFYDRMGNLVPEDFASFIDPDNYVSQLVIMHMLVLDFVMMPHAIEDGSMNNSSPGFRKGFHYRRAMSKVWVEQIQGRLPSEYHQYAKWPVAFVRTLKYSINKDQVWKPFLLSEGKITLPADSSSLSAIEWQAIL